MVNPLELLDQTSFDLDNMDSEVMQKLETIIVESEIGGGMVKVKMDATPQVRELTLNAELQTLITDTEMLESLIVSAVNDSLGKALEKQKELVTHEGMKAVESFIIEDT